MSKRVVVAIDGPAGAGKSTAAKMLAARLGYVLLDTGAIYRALALLATRKKIAWSDGPALGELAAELPIRFGRLQDVQSQTRVWLGDEEVSLSIRTPEISEGASTVSAHKEVRRALLALQRSVATVPVTEPELGQGVVAEGRDMGTVVFPDADCKFFLTADMQVRAHRRLEELVRGGANVSFEETLADMIKRDERDTEREAAPLKKADDALEIDSSALGIDEVVAKMLAVVYARAAGGSPASAGTRGTGGLG